MKKRLLSGYLYLILLSTIILSSCETEGVSRISFDNNTFALRVGQSDTLVSTISFTGDINDFPVEWKIDDPTIISIVEMTNDSHSKGSVTKSVVINALKTGTSRRLRTMFAQELAGVYSKPVLWSRSYCVLSCGGAPLEIIKQYIQQQDRPDD